ncbi:MAG: hypothetical protein AAGA12_03220 [Pseudomonadota bacterium]
MSKLVPFALCAAFLAHTAFAQSPAQQAAVEIRNAMQLCLQNYEQPQQIFTGLTQAGYRYTKEDFGGGPDDVLHWFNRADNLINVAVVARPQLTECRISTDFIGVPLALQFAGIALTSLFQGDVQEGSLENVNVKPGDALSNQQECSGYSFLAPRRAIWVAVGTAGQDPVCVDNGTSQIMMRM